VGHGVEHLAQKEAAAGGDLDGGLVEIGGAPARQRSEMAALEVDLRPAAGIATADQLGDEATIGAEILEVAAAAHSSACSIAVLRWPCRLSTAPFSWAWPRLLRLAVMP